MTVGRRGGGGGDISNKGVVDGALHVAEKRTPPTSPTDDDEL